VVPEESEPASTTAVTITSDTTFSSEDSPQPDSTTFDPSSPFPSSTYESTTTSSSSSHVLPARTPSSMTMTMTSSSSTDKVAAETVDTSDDDLCKLCFESPIDTVILDCGHALLCARCADELRIGAGCPVCRSPIRCVQKMYKC
jgi:hypothetical protein